MKVYNTQVVMQEFPDEFTLALNISGCPNHCLNCHSKYLWEDIGEDLTIEYLLTVIKNNPGITCIGFMGGDQDPDYLMSIAKEIKQYTNIKLGWYSGKDYIYNKAMDLFDYVKFGSYQEDRGPLTSKSTNQILLYISEMNGKRIAQNISYRLHR